MLNKLRYIHFNTGGTLFRLFLFVLFYIPVKGQITVHYKSQNLSLDTKNKFLQGNVDIIITNISQQPIDTLYLLHWLKAYQHTGTHLADELLEDQNARMRFANAQNIGGTAVSVTIQ